MNNTKTDPHMCILVSCCLSNCVSASVSQLTADEPDSKMRDRKEEVKNFLLGKDYMIMSPKFQTIHITDQTQTGRVHLPMSSSPDTDDGTVGVGCVGVGPQAAEAGTFFGSQQIAHRENPGQRKEG